jgi:CubicO group peptidase (beta-lactamase class C family)
MFIAKLNSECLLLLALVAVGAGLHPYVGLAAQGTVAGQAEATGDKSGINGEGFVQRWLVLAPIPFVANETPSDAFNREQIKDEAGLRPKAGDKVKIGDKDLTWQKKAAAGHKLDFLAILGKKENDDSVAYAVSYVVAPKELKAIKMKIGSDDQCRVYLNGKEVFSYPDCRAMKKDQDTVEVTLLEGMNVLVAKVVNCDREWEFCVRFTDRDDRPLTDLKAQDQQTSRTRANDEKDHIVARLQRVVPGLLEEKKVPGLSMALIQNGDLVWHRGFGIKSAKTKEPVVEDTVFEAASLSKPIFAYLILKLVEAGLLDLDVPLQKYLPGNYDVGDDARLGKITARHVLSHTPGFPNWRRGSGPLTIHFTPGERFSYSGEGYVYLAQVVEHVTGEKLNDIVSKRVFDPLKMTDSSFVWRESYDQQHSSPHDASGNPTGQSKPTKANAAASLHTTARDYGRFLVAVMRGTGLKAGTRKQMLTPEIKLSESGTNNTASAPEKLSSSLSWGLGWGLQSTGDGLALWHWGDNGNYKSYIVAYDKQQFGIVVFTNGANGLSMMPEIIDEAIGGEQPALEWLTATQRGVMVRPSAPIAPGPKKRTVDLVTHGT